MIIETLNSIYTHLSYPKILYLIIPLGLIIIWALKTDFIKVEKRQHSNLILGLRILTLIFFIIALAAPFANETYYLKGNPRVKILLDESNSFSLFNQKEISEFIKKIEKRVSVESQTIAVKDSSPLGDGILNNLKEYENLLLITDGHSTQGTELEEVAVYANSINATISSLKLEAETYDASISIDGPSKTTANVENTFTVNIDQSRKSKLLDIRISIDGIPIINQQNEESFTFSQTFADGYHEIVGELLAQEDKFKENNKFYKTVKVVPKPKVLLYSEKPTDLSILVSPMYELSTETYIPDNLKDYNSIIVNDIPASTLKQKIPELTDFVAEGNGMVVIGGQNSYDLGDYKGSLFEQMLPVYVAQAGKKQGNINLVIVIDISKSTGKDFGENKLVDVEKAISLDILRSISVINNVGVVAFNTESYVVGEIKPLIEHSDLEDKISKLKDIGGTRIFQGVIKATEMLQNQAGSKNIIIITDGKTEGYDESISAVNRAKENGIRTYTVGIGSRANNKLLEILAEVGNGAFFEPEKREGLKILFGDPKKGETQKEGYSISTINSNHFITKDLDIKAGIFGFNTVTPKTSAKLLVTTDTGDPLITTWRYGLGRVVSFTTDDGSLFAPETLNKANSKIWTRTINWAVGDPEKKQNNYINIEDTRINEPAIINIKSTKLPSSDEVSFTKLEDNTFEGSFLPEGIGFHEKFNAKYAVNNIKELERIGYNEELLEDVSSITEGKIFKIDQIEEVVKFVQANSKRQKFGKISKAWIFAILAIITFLIEICFRRISKNKGLSDELKSKGKSLLQKFKKS